MTTKEFEQVWIPNNEIEQALLDIFEKAEEAIKETYKEFETTYSTIFEHDGKRFRLFIELARVFCDKKNGELKFEVCLDYPHLQEVDENNNLIGNESESDNFDYDFFYDNRISTLYLPVPAYEC